jgi:phytoene synthase
MRLLPAPRRNAMFAIYAFCREVDDVADEVADEVADIAKKQTAIMAWREEIEALYADRPSRPTTRALIRPVRDYSLPKEEFLAILDGMAMDAEERMRAPALSELLLYCRRVAGAVGVLSVHAFGDSGDAARRLAVVEGEALQLTNILRDLAEDAERGRLYLPREYLEEAGVDYADAGRALSDPALPVVCRRLAVLAEEKFREAHAMLGACDRKAMKPAIVMLEAYHRLLKKLQASDWRDPTQRASLPRLEKLWVALKHGFL